MWDCALHLAMAYLYEQANFVAVHLVLHAETGEVMQRLEYGPWGEVLEDTNPGFVALRLRGGAVRAGGGPGALWRAGVLPEPGPLAVERPDPLRRRRHEPLRLLRQRPGELRGPDGVDPD